MLPPQVFFLEPEGMGGKLAIRYCSKKKVFFFCDANWGVFLEHTLYTIFVAEVSLPKQAKSLRVRSQDAIRI